MFLIQCSLRNKRSKGLNGLLAERQHWLHVLSLVSLEIYVAVCLTTNALLLMRRSITQALTLEVNVQPGKHVTLTCVRVWARAYRMLLYVKRLARPRS
jgi:hypothetical protein